MRPLSIFLILLIGLCVGIGGTILFYQNKPVQVSKAQQIRQGGYSYINPLLECEVGLTSQTSFTPIKTQIEDIINNIKSRGMAEEVSVYLRDLNNGPYLGINDDAEFSPASLLKIPIMIAYYKEAESNPDILKKKVKLDVDQDYNSWESLQSPHFVKIGEEYTNEELINAMIVSSDNNAMVKLSSSMSIALQDDVYKDLGVTIPGQKGLNDFMTVREYASFFRILYNASYLSPEYSEKALKLLTGIDFKDGMRAGIPAQVKVASKFGEREYKGAKQLHECGIVYADDRPFLLCIMTRGDDLSELTQTVRELSSVIYTKITAE